MRYQSKLEQVRTFRDTNLSIARKWLRLKGSYDCLYLDQQYNRATSEAERFANMLHRLGVARVTLGRRLDAYKSNWFEWECTAHLNDGTELEGHVQGDYAGNLVDLHTFDTEEKIDLGVDKQANS